MTPSATGDAPGLARAETNLPTVAAPAVGRPAFDRRMLEVLVCPLTQSVLTYDADRQELSSVAASLAFPIRGGIPIMLVSEARTL